MSSELQHAHIRRTKLYVYCLVAKGPTRRRETTSKLKSNLYVWLSGLTCVVAPHNLRYAQLRALRNDIIYIGGAIGHIYIPLATGNSKPNSHSFNERIRPLLSGHLFLGASLGIASDRRKIVKSPQQIGSNKPPNPRNFDASYENGKL